MSHPRTENGAEPADSPTDSIVPKYSFIIRQSCDTILEIALDTGLYKQTVFSTGSLFTFPPEGNYLEVLEQTIQTEVDRRDAARVREAFHLDYLRFVYASGTQNHADEFRLDKNRGLIWVEGRILLLREDAPSVVLQFRDVTEQRKERPKMPADLYDKALRCIYDELIELNATRDTYRIVYHTKNKYCVPPEKMSLSECKRIAADELIHPDDRLRFLDFSNPNSIRHAFAAGRSSLLGEFRSIWEDGSYHWASLTIVPIKSSSTGDEILLCFVMDIGEKKRDDELSEQRRLMKAQKEEEERCRVIVEQTGTIVFEWNLDANLYYVPPEMVLLFEGNYDRRDLLTIWQEDRVVHPHDLPILQKFCTSLFNGENYLEMTVRLKSRARGFLWCKVAMTRLLDASGQVKRIIGTLNDVDEATRSEEALKYRTEYDTLTGIYNIQAFYTGTQRLLKLYPDKQYAVLRMDINRFKFINELYGIEEGDRLLCFIANTIQRQMTSIDAFGRLGGDVFVMCVAFNQEKELIGLVERIAGQLPRYGLGYKALPSFGICIVDDRNVPVSILCDRANLALRTVKGKLIRKWAFYDEKLRAQQLEERTIENEMDDALEQEQFEVYFQPKHNLKTGKIVGAEALVRWNNPREGLMSPAKFIPLFERNGFIIRLDEYVWEVSCRMLRRWLDCGMEPVPISVNVSRIHIYNPGFCEKIVGLTERYKLNNALVELELTESTFIENPNELYATMKSLQDLGFAFSMDDFGSGYSSLNMLKDAQVDTIKLDRAFLNEAATAEKGKTVVRHTIAMAHDLNLQVVAEGVETEEQAKFLSDCGCSTAQGYLFSRPMPPQEFERMLFGADLEEALKPAFSVGT